MGCAFSFYGLGRAGSVQCLLVPEQSVHVRKCARLFFCACQLYGLLDLFAALSQGGPQHTFAHDVLAVTDLRSGRDL